MFFSSLAPSSPPFSFRGSHQPLPIFCSASSVQFETGNQVTFDDDDEAAAHEVRSAKGRYNEKKRNGTRESDKIAWNEATLSDNLFHTDAMLEPILNKQVKVKCCLLMELTEVLYCPTVPMHRQEKLVTSVIKQ